jgi:hypothetical protein
LGSFRASDIGRVGDFEKFWEATPAIPPLAASRNQARSPRIPQVLDPRSRDSTDVVEVKRKAKHRLHFSPPSARDAPTYGVIRAPVRRLARTTRILLRQKPRKTPGKFLQDSRIAVTPFAPVRRLVRTARARV